MKHFNRMTKTTKDKEKRNAVIMGRNTWESIPAKFRPLGGRMNLLISSKAVKEPENFSGCIPFSSFEAAVTHADSQSDVETTWAIGGTSIYKAAIDSKSLHRIYLTRILKDFECDVFFPDFDEDQFTKAKDDLVSEEEQKEGDISYRYEIYEKQQTLN